MDRRSGRIAAALALLVVSVVPFGAVTAPPAAAAGPTPASTPTAGPSTDPGLPLEVWLDRPVPTDAAPGSTVRLGLTIWDRSARRLAPVQGMILRWQPATGTAQPSQTTMVADWTGHGIATLVVPEGGAGRLEVGFHGEACDQDGCRPTDTLFPIAGVGPPPDAALPLIAGVEIRTDGAIVAGQPAAVSIVLQPKAAWTPADFPIPDQLVLRARIPRGDPLASATATLADAAERRYRAEILLPDPASYILDVATILDPSADEVFSTSLATVTAIPTDRATPEPASGSGGAGDGSGLILPIALVLVGLAMLGGLVLVVRREN